MRTAAWNCRCSRTVRVGKNRSSWYTYAATQQHNTTTDTAQPPASTKPLNHCRRQACLPALLPACLPGPPPPYLSCRSSRRRPAGRPRTPVRGTSGSSARCSPAATTCRRLPGTHITWTDHHSSSWSASAGSHPLRAPRLRFPPGPQLPPPPSSRPSATENAPEAPMSAIIWPDLTLPAAGTSITAAPRGCRQPGPYPAAPPPGHPPSTAAPSTIGVWPTHRRPRGWASAPSRPSWPCPPRHPLAAHSHTSSGTTTASPGETTARPADRRTCGQGQGRRHHPSGEGHGVKP